MGKNKKVLSAVILSVLVIIFCITAGVLLYFLASYKKGADEYSELNKMVSDNKYLWVLDLEDVHSGNKESDTSEGMKGKKEIEIIDKAAITELAAINPDTAAWIEIPGTAISYPVVQGRDNIYYLNHTFRGTENAAGTIFMESLNEGSFAYPNTILYGHNMKDGSMFGSLSGYKNPSYWEKHKYIYLTTKSGISRYRIFSCYSTQEATETYRIFTDFGSSYKKYLSDISALSLYSMGEAPTEGAQIITLSTCEGKQNNRFVIHAEVDSVQVN